MLKLTKMGALLLAVSVPGVGLTPAAEVTVTWDGSAGTPYWNDPVPAVDNDWGNWDGNPNPVNGDTVALDLGASDTKLKSDISAWPINWVDLWPSSGTVTLTIENGGHLQVDWEIRMYPHNGTTSQILIQGGTYQGRVVYGGHVELSGSGTWTGATYSGPGVHVIGSSATVTHVSMDHPSLPMGPYTFTLDAGGVSPVAFTGGNPIDEGMPSGIPLEVFGIQTYIHAGMPAGDIIPLITFPDGVTDNDIINLFPSSQWVYDDTLAILTVDNRGARLEIIFEPVSATVLLIR